MNDPTSETLKLSSSLPLDDPNQRLCPHAPALCRCPVPKDSNGRSVRPYIVYPIDGNIVDAATQQLESFGSQPETRLNPHISLNGWGVMYWEIHLTQDQVAELIENPEVEVIDAPTMHSTVRY